MENFWLLEIAMGLNLKIDDILNEIWFEKKCFIGYPDIIEPFLLKIFQKKENILEHEKLLSLDIAKHIPEKDHITGLYFDFNQYNLTLIKKYMILLKENNNFLQKIRVFRIWGDIMNMGGLNISLSKVSELENGKEISQNGYSRADIVRKAIFSSVKEKFLKFPSFLNHICIEGGDEIGGYFVTNQYTNDKILNKLISEIIQEVNEAIECIGLGNIIYSKDENSTKIIGIGISLISKEILLERKININFQSQLENLILKNKQDICKSRLGYFKKPRKRLNDCELSNFQEKIKSTFETLLLIESNTRYEIFKHLNYEKFTYSKDLFELNTFQIRALKIQKEYLKRNNRLLNLLIKKYSFPQLDKFYRNSDLISNILLCGMAKKYYLNKDSFFIIIKENNFVILNEKFHHDYCNNIFRIFRKIILETFEAERTSKNLKCSDILYFNSVTINYSTRNKVGILIKDGNIKEITYLLEKLYLKLKKLIIKLNLDQFYTEDNKLINGKDFTFLIEKLPLDLLTEKNIEDFLYLACQKIREVENDDKFLNSNIINPKIIKRDDLTKRVNIKTCYTNI